MRVLVACEFSGIVREAFRARGHDAWSCDILPAEDNSRHHYQLDALAMVKAGGPDGDWDLLIAHPPCTYLCNSGVRWIYNADGSPNYERKVAFRDAAHFFVQLKHSPIARIAIENPIPHKYAKEWIGKYDQIIQPWMFGHGEIKATCLWLKNLPFLQPTNVVSGRQPRAHHASPGPDRWKERSRTLKGIADAMADQWGSL